MNLSKKAIFLSLLMSGTLYAATVSTIEVVTSFSKTGGVYGDGKLSVVGGKVNGVDICPSANTNANTVPGCDMSQDPGYSDEGTPDPHDDKYTGDLIIRTNDIFEMNVGWNATGVNNPVTLTSTLTSSFLRWEPLPSSCKTGSSISADGLTLTCVRINDASISYSEDSSFYVKVKGNTPNNTKTGVISFTISTDGLESKSDDTDGFELTVTASPKWNIEKKYVTYSLKTHNDIEGYIIRYAYLLEADEVLGETDTTSAVMGNEALGKDISLEFTDDVSKISPNAELVDCAIVGASMSYDPYPWYNTTYPERSVGSLESALAVNCTQAGGKGTDISIAYSGIDASLDHVATKTGSNRDIPTTRLPLASGVINIFIPLTDVNSSDNLKSNDTYQLTTINTITSFDPDSISGQSNFGAATESIKDNSATLTLTYRGSGYMGGTYRKYFTNSVNGGVLPDTTNSYYSADGIVTPNKKFGAFVYIQNSGNQDFNDTLLCDVIDSNLYDVVDMESNSSSAVKLYSHTATLEHTIEYATGYVGAWPPPINQNNSALVIDECRDENVQWFDTTEGARAGGSPITKVRLRIPNGLPAKKYAGFTINLKARSSDLSGVIIPTGTELVNYSAMHDTVYLKSYPDNWYGATRILKEYPSATSGGAYRADRAILMRAKVRTSKLLSKTTVEPSDEIEVTIHSTFTTDNQDGETDNVKIIEVLDPGLGYIVGSGNIGDPVFGTCADLEDSDSLKSICTTNHQVLVWDLGEKTANQSLTDIKYKFIVGAITPQGTNHTYTIISSPTDTSNVNIRKANKNISISIPSSLFVSKEVNTPFRNIDQSPIEFTSYARNGSSKNLTNVDIIDILPFNGDGTDGFTFTVGSTAVAKKRYQPTAFNGTLAFESASGGHACESGVTWYFTNKNPKLMDIAPTAVTNKAGGDTTWCAGTATGPDGACGFDNAGVTAVRLTGPALDADATCSFKVFLKPVGNKKGDIYTNTASAFAQGVTLPTLSNDVSAIVPSTLLGDFVWIDSNANGIQDSGELGVGGITLELLDSSNGVINTTTSDSSGRYIFEELTEDTEYKVKATIPDYYTFSPKSQGKDDTKDSDVNTTTGITEGKKLNLNQQYKHLDIGLTSSLTISGKVYKKDNNDSISDIAVKLYFDKNGDNLLDADDTLVKSLDSDKNGEYNFVNIFDGNYIVVVDKNDSDVPEGYVVSSKDVLDVTVDKKSVVDKDFPFAPPTVETPTYTLGNYVWEDSNRDGIQDKNETGVKDINVTLYNSSNCTGDINATTQTSNDGAYLFSKLVAGDYCIEFTNIPRGYSITKKGVADDSSNSDANSDGKITDIKLSANNLDKDMGIVALSTEASIGDFVWIDSNANGIQDSGELGADGITLELLDSSDKVIKTTTSGSSGQYIFQELTDDTAYKVKATIPNYYTFSSKAQGGDDTKDSDVDTTTGITGSKTLTFNQQYKDLDIGLTSSLSISGNVYKKDNNASISSIGVKLYFDKNGDNLLDNNDVLVKGLDTNESGEYIFTNIFNGNYIVVVEKEDSHLPKDYILADKEVLDVTVDKKSVVEKNFPFILKNIPPTSDNKSHDPILNSSDAFTLKELTGTDTDGTVVGFVINSLPTEAQGILSMSDETTPVTVNQVLTPAEVKGLKFNPKEGYSGDVTFTYSSKDNSGAIDATPATVTIPVIGIISISGTLYADGSGDKNINGKAISKADDSPIYVSLLSNIGAVLSSKPLDAKGEYSFNDKDGVSPDTNYSLVITTQENGTSASLPTNWNNADGENINSKSPTGNDGQVEGAGDGKISVEVATSSIPKIDFGINKRPMAEDKNETTQANPGSDVSVSVPALIISDNEDKNLSTITIVTTPNNGTLYYNGAVSEGQVIHNFEPSKFKVDPESGDQNITFTYTTTDRAGVVSDEATVILPFTDIGVSGKLFDDGNGDGDVNGTLISKADETQLHVTLIDSNNKVIASKALASDGTYGFSTAEGVQPNTDYTIVLTDSADKTTPTLPDNWNNADGENIGLTGLDGNANGMVSVSVTTTNISEINFGINKKPVAGDKTQEKQFNPGTDVKVTVSTLEISDKEDGTPSVITVINLPTNGTLYYDGKPVVLDAEISDVNSSKFSVDPDSGDPVVVFEYTTTDRVNVVSEKATVTIPFTALEIKGNVFNDGNNDNTINGTAISAPNGIQLYATLTDKIRDNVLATMPINGDGTYGFSENDGILAENTYHIVLSTEGNRTSPSLPLKWNNKDGEHIGVGEGLDENADGIIKVIVGQESVVEVNFGINKKPVAGDNTAPLQLNPGTDRQVDVPDLNVTDSEDGTPTKVTIVTVPANGILYYDGVAVVASQVIENLDNTKLKLDPDNGDQSVSFTYKTTDAVGVESDIATIAMSFKGLKISGHIFDDGNNDETVNGRKISLVDGSKLYATLLDSSGEMMASRAIDAEGSYLFNGMDGVIPNSEYKVVLTTELNGTTPKLSTNWNNADGEHIGTDKGLDDSPNGSIDVSVVDEDVPEVNFGLNKKPTADNLEVPSQLNPKGTAQITVPNLKIMDKEDGVLATITIKSLPSGGILYYNGIEVTESQVISEFTSKKLTVDPKSGTPTIEFTYSTVDKAGVESNIAKVTMPFRGLSISGNLFNDGVKDSIINGTKVAKAGEVELYVTLVSSDGTALASKKLNENGGYSFDSSESIEANSNYKVVLNSIEDATDTELPTNWNFVDSKAVLEVKLKEVNIENIDFSINHKPMVKNIEGATQTNPTGDKRVVVPVLIVLDKEDGIPTTITIKTLPSEGTLYYNGVAVTQGQVIINYNKTKLEIDPIDGTITVEFTYSTTDRAGVESEVSSVKMPFRKVEMVIQPTPTPIPTSSPTLIVTPNPTATVSPTPTGTPLPSIAPRPVIDTPAPMPRATPRPTATVSPTPTSTPVVNTAPKAENVESPMVDNPGGDIKVSVVDLNISDSEDGTPTTVTILSLPTGGTLYYIGEEVTRMQEIKSFDNGKLEVDPDNGAQTIVFNYTTTDSEGLTSQPARVRMPFAAVGAKENFNISDDNVLANTQGPQTVINVLGNDDVRTGSSIRLLNNSNGTPLWLGGTAVGGAAMSTTDSLMVPGEGTWDVRDGKIVFTAEDGFTGTPTPVYYMVKDQHGNSSNVAQVSIKSPCVCKTYKSDSVAILGKIWIIFMMLFTSILALLLFRKEKKVIL